ncbi:MAG: PAS-domain containing protein [Hyphomicrobiaceae bacterium]
MGPQVMKSSQVDAGNLCAMPDLDTTQVQDQNAELAYLMAGADVGLALFDSELRLLVSNQLYRTLCGYQDSDVTTGVPLSQLIRISLERHKMPVDDVDRLVEESLSRLEPGISYSFTYTSTTGRKLVIGRRRLSSGSVVETVREDSRNRAEPVDLNAQFSKIADAARERMMHALDVMADGFALFDAQDRLVVYNRQYVDLCPNVADLIIPGAKYEEVLREAIRRGTYCLNGMDEEAYFQQRLHRHRNPTEPYELNLTDERWVLINERRTTDGGTVKIRSDISEMKQREFDMLRVSKKLHNKNVHFDSALNNMVQGLCMFDDNQELIVCNRRYLEMYGFSPDVVKPGIKLAEIMNYSISLGNYNDEDARRALTERRDPTALSQRVTIKQKLRDGRTIAVMNEPMAEGGTIATYQDITESEQFAEQTQIYLKKLEQSNRELQEFAYVASHDLQEPLRKIEAFGDRLSTRYGETLPDDGKMFIDRMQNAASRMRLLINDLLAYSRVSTKVDPPKMIDLNHSLEGVLSDLQIRIDELNAEIISDDLPNIEADPTQIRMLLQNLISNALKFQKPDTQPIVRIESEMIASEISDSEPGTVRIKVIDNGIGFDNAYKDTMFKIFQRLHGRLEYEGTGVGLATVRKIVERHGGKLDADGRLDEGATFIIDLPIKQMKSGENGLPEVA